MAWTIDGAATARRQLRKLDSQIARRIVDFMDERVAAAPRVAVAAIIEADSVVEGVAMRQVGLRREPLVVARASGTLLAEGARFNDAVSRLAQSTFVPKGVYRFSSHDAANRHAMDCLVRGMASRALKRG